MPRDFRSAISPSKSLSVAGPCAPTANACGTRVRYTIQPRSPFTSITTAFSSVRAARSRTRPRMPLVADAEVREVCRLHELRLHDELDRVAGRRQLHPREPRPLDQHRRVGRMALD